MKKEKHLSKGNYFFRGDRQIWIIVLALMLISIVEVYSTTASLAYRIAGGDTEHYLLKQIALLALGGIAMFGVHMFPTGIYARLVIPVLLITGIWLGTTLAFGMEANSARRWTQVLGVTLQPSDFVRIPLIIYIAITLAEKREQLKSFSYVLFPLVFAIGTICVLILFANFSTAVLVGVSCFILLMIGNIKWRYLLYVLLIAVGGLVAFIKLAPYFPFSTRVATWASRWDTFWNAGGDNFQGLHAKIAIANGLLWGKGPGNSMQRLVLPESYSDFIFASLVEEGGLILAIIVMGLYIWLLFRIYAIMRASRKPYHTYLCAGFGILIVLQAFVHIAISIGWGPVTGLPLPLVSMGGSSVLATCIELGMIQSVARQQKKELYEGEVRDVA